MILSPVRRLSNAESLAGVVLLLGVLQFALFVYFFAISLHPMPRWDFFDWVTGYLEAPSFLPWLWAQHNEHRVVGSKLVAAMDVAFFDGRMLPVALVAVAALFLRTGLVGGALLRTPGISSEQSRWVVGCLLLLSFPTFTLDTYTYPTNFQFGTVSFFLVAAVVALQPSAKSGEGTMPVGRLAVAVGAGIACTLSSANGLFVWPILAWSAWRQRLRLALGSVLAVGALTGAAYFFDYSWPRSTPLYVDSPADFLKFVEYFIAYFGMPWVSVPWLYAPGMLVGALIVLAGATAVIAKGLFRRSGDEVEVIGAAFLLFAGATALVTAFGRLHLTGVPAHRYAAFPQLARIGLFLLLLPWAFVVWRDPGKRRRLLAATVVVAIAMLVQQVVVGQFAASRAEHFARVRDAIHAGNRDLALAREVYPQPKRLEHHLRLYEREGIYLYRKSGPRSDEAERGPGRPVRDQLNLDQTGR